MYEPWQIIVHACFGILLFPLYIFVLINFLFPKLNKPFQSYFFKIATILGFVDITSYITVWIFVKLPASPLTYQLFLNSDKSYFFNILSFLRFYTTLTRCCLLIISSANRYTALNYAIQHDMWWNKYGKCVIIVCLILPLIFTFDLLFGVLRVFNNKEAISIDATNGWGFPRPTQVVVVFTTITCVVTLILSILSWRKLMKQARFNTNNLNVKNFIAERSLLVIAFWDFSVDSLYVSLNAWQIYRTIVGRTTQDDTPYILIIWILDLNNLFRPIFLILMCKALKKAFLKYICFKNKKAKNGVIQGQSNQLKIT